MPQCALLGLACLLSYWLVTTLLPRLHPVSASDEIVGGLWAAIATVFVLRSSYPASVHGRGSRGSRPRS